MNKTKIMCNPVLKHTNKQHSINYSSTHISQMRYLERAVAEVKHYGTASAEPCTQEWQSCHLITLTSCYVCTSLCISSGVQTSKCN